MTSLNNTKSKKPIYYLIFIFMASLIIFLSLFLSLSLSSAARRRQETRSKIHEACKSTRFPDQCKSSLTHSNLHLPSNPTPLQIIQSSIWVSSLNLQTAQSMLKKLLEDSSSSRDRNLSTAAINCLENLRYSDYRISLTTDAIVDARIKDARAWLSASLHYQFGCWSGLSKFMTSETVEKTVSFLESLVELSSNALSMMVNYDNLGNSTGSWRVPETERVGFWEDTVSSGSGLSVGFPTNLSADVTVCKDGGSGCLTTVQAAVEAAPENGTARFVIHIKEGVYEEIVRVPLEKRNVVILGDGMGKTVITGSLNVGQLGISTYDSATVGVLGDGFMASGLTIQNTAGPDAHQAVAFRSDSDLSIIQNCEFIGFQDTLYAHSLRQLYKSCRILGNVDFIFGNSASIFQDSEILIRPRPRLDPDTRYDNVIAAHGRTDPAQSTGFVFQNCLINGTEEFMSLYYKNPEMHQSFLGRPWKEYSRTVFIRCDIEALVSPAGWMPWNGEFGLKTLYYGEYENSGMGSKLSKRVNWSSQIPEEHVFTYSLENFIQANKWFPFS